MSLFFVLATTLAHAGARFPVIGCDAYLAREFSRRPIPARSTAMNPSFRRSDTVTVGPLVTPESIAAAYRNGLFPWGASFGNHGQWSHPRARGVLEFRNLKIPRKDRRYIERTLASNEFLFTENEDFERIITACARNFRGTWITPGLARAYVAASDQGLIVADAAWVNENGRRGDLAGAMYGVDIDGNYSGESMRRFRSDVLKVLMYRRIEKLKAMGREFMDVQEAILDDPVNPDPDYRPSLLVKWGARPIPRKAYLRLMRAAQERDRSLCLLGPGETVGLDGDRTR